MKIKGWYKRARKKFVKKRVFRWSFTVYGGGASMRASVEHRRFSREIKYRDKDKSYQIVTKVAYAGFVNGFWLGRKLVRKKPDKYYLSFDKRIELEVK